MIGEILSFHPICVITPGKLDFSFHGPLKMTSLIPVQSRRWFNLHSALWERLAWESPTNKCRCPSNRRRPFQWWYSACHPRVCGSILSPGETFFTLFTRGKCGYPPNRQRAFQWWYSPCHTVSYRGRGFETDQVPNIFQCIQLKIGEPTKSTTGFRMVIRRYSQTTYTRVPGSNPNDSVVL